MVLGTESTSSDGSSPVAHFEQAVFAPTSKMLGASASANSSQEKLITWGLVTVFLERHHLLFTISSTVDSRAASLRDGLCKQSLFSGGAEIWKVWVTCSRPLRALLDVIHSRRTCQSWKVEGTMKGIGSAYCPLNSNVTHEVTLTEEQRNTGKLEGRPHSSFLECLVIPKAWCQPSSSFHYGPLDGTAMWSEAVEKSETSR